MIIAIDGDNVGDILELYILDEQIQELENFSHALKNRFQWLVNELCDLLGAKIHLLGGDSILASLEYTQEAIKIIEKLRADFHQDKLPTISVGIGNTFREAYLALKYAKLRGKNCLITFEEIKQ